MASESRQEAFWRGDFGDAYTERSRGAQSIAANTAFFAKVLERTRDVRSILELGSNIGLNLVALRQLLPRASLTALEINERAARELSQQLPEAELHVASVLDFAPDRTWDLVFTSALLIHIEPAELPRVYGIMHRCTERYLLVSEFYNPKPVEVPYRGNAGMLFKRDFAGEMLDTYHDLHLVDYGFVYHRDPNFALEDTNWFLLEKR